MRFITAALLTIFLAGCMVGPDYKQPESPLPEGFQSEGAKDYTTDAVEIGWWSEFNDPILDTLVRDALAGNYDIQIATARILEARALRAETEFELAPIVPFQGDYTWQRSSKAQTFPGADRNGALFDAGFDAVWELDIFGRIRRTIEADTAELESRIATRRDVVVTLLAEVARNYFELRGAQNGLDVARKNAENQKNTLDLTITLLEAGRGTELDVSRARAQYNNTLALIPPLETRVRQAIYRIGVLTGQLPDTYLVELLEPKPFPVVPEIVAVGTPVELMERRPDIRVAERQLAAFTAAIGIATADLFPRITIFGSAALQATSFSGLFDSGGVRSRAEHILAGVRPGPRVPASRSRGREDAGGVRCVSADRSQRDRGRRFVSRRSQQRDRKEQVPRRVCQGERERDEAREDEVRLRCRELPRRARRGEDAPRNAERACAERDGASHVARRGV
jgi:multidrug efflux system outer membrane protein